MRATRWSPKPPEPALEHELARACGISALTARLLVNRGILTPREARVFLWGTPEDMHAPEMMRDLPALARAVTEAAMAGEKILVYGDYDVDGMTATAILVKAIRLLGGDALYYVPRRAEGYGVHPEPLLKAAGEGVRVAVTVDCGITAHEAVRAAAAQGMRLLITDHHRPQGDLPETLVVNPRRDDCCYPFKELAGAGVALKVAQSLLQSRFREHSAEFFGLACLGTIADVVPLTGENRLLVRFGLRGVRDNPGLNALADALGLAGEPSVRDVAYLLAPRLNAAGRLGDARVGVELLLSKDPGEQVSLVDELLRLNHVRQELEGRIMAEILATLSTRESLPPAAVFAGEGWHPGVTGVVASRMAEHLGRPVLVVAVEGDEARGSGRCGPDFDVFQALDACRSYLTEFGGHRCAAGFTVRRNDLEAFKAAFLAEVEAGTRREPPPVDIDAVVSLADLSVDVVTEIERLAPWGHGNPEPLLGAVGVYVLDTRPVGRDGAHLKMTVRQDGSDPVSAIAFRRGQDVENLCARGRVGLVFTPMVNEWRDRRSVELRVVEWPEPAEMQNRAQRAPSPLKGLFGAAAALAESETPPTLLALFRAGKAAETFAWPPRARRHPGRLVDRREHPARNAWLAERLRDGVPTLVVVGTPRRAPLVAAALRRREPSMGDRVAFLHPRLPGEQYEAVAALWRAGKLACLVLAAEDLAAVEQVPRTVVYDLPYDWSAWEAICEAAESLELAFRDDDRSANRRLLQTLAPGRTCIGALYTMLQRVGAGPYVTSAEGLARALGSRLALPVAPWTVTVGLAVLADLGLAEYHEEGDGRVAVLARRAAGKRGLAASATFRRVHEIKRLSLRRQRRFVEAAAEEVAATLGLPKPSGGNPDEV
ncbi:MAG: single-stranded-DNA-specific exonuclease RecJ [Bacillota bacterium]|nr:single-stranded-DNA-specific exonuclease RecJ [Bacillota bacterium]